MINNTFGKTRNLGEDIKHKDTEIILLNYWYRSMSLCVWQFAYNDFDRIKGRVKFGGPYLSFFGYGYPVWSLGSRMWSDDK